MDREEWQEKSLDEIIDEFNRKHPNCNWEGSLKITKEDLQDYQKPF